MMSSMSRSETLSNVHAMCGQAAIAAAVDNAGSCKVLAVTILTSLDACDLENIGFDLSLILDEKQAIIDLTVYLAQLAEKAGAYGVVCSPHEVSAIKRDTKLVTVTPGVRPVWATTNDQKRIMTPAEAIKAGADHLVIGRPITNPPQMLPFDAAKLVYDEVNSI